MQLWTKAHSYLDGDPLPHRCLSEPHFFSLKLSVLIFPFNIGISKHLLLWMLYFLVGYIAAVGCSMKNHCSSILWIPLIEKLRTLFLFFLLCSKTTKTSLSSSCFCSQLHSLLFWVLDFSLYQTNKFNTFSL